MRKYKFKVVNKNNGSCIIDSRSSFYLQYQKGKNVYADKDSLGVMVFNKKQSAKDFITSHHFDWKYNSQKWKIKRVIPIGRGKTPKYISIWALSEDVRSLNNLIKSGATVEEIRDKLTNDITSPIKGTICYPGVYVVD